MPRNRTQNNSFLRIKSNADFNATGDTVLVHSVLYHAETKVRIDARMDSKYSCCIERAPVVTVLRNILLDSCNKVFINRLIAGIRVSCALLNKSVNVVVVSKHIENIFRKM